jgi:hypothetical protein
MQNDSQVSTIVQQIDAQGATVVSQISTQFADLACTSDNARKLVEALHSGTSVTLSGNGKSATFTPTGGSLGYGDAYIALALAAEALRNAGVSGCATPDQWQAVLMGGPLTAAGTTSTSTSRISSASSSSQFPGILTLHSQGQGWGQIAQTANVQLGQIVSSARSSLNLGSDSTLSPTGRSSSDYNSSRSSTSPSSSTTTSPSSSSSSSSSRDSSSSFPSSSSSTSSSHDSSSTMPKADDTNKGRSGTGKDSDAQSPSSSSSSSSSSSTPRSDK